MDRVQQLKMERNYMQERQQELLQQVIHFNFNVNVQQFQGLLDQQQSPHQTQAAVQQFGSPPCVMQGSPYDSAPATTHTNYQMNQMMDNQMEIDYQNGSEPLIDTASIVQVKFPSKFALHPTF